MPCAYDMVGEDDHICFESRQLHYHSVRMALVVNCIGVKPFYDIFS